MKIALGTAQFGLNYGIANNHGQVSFHETKAILKQAHSSGINTLDTAISYGNSENRLGEIGIQDWKVVSKLPEIPKDSNNISSWVTIAVEGSLERLKVRSIYGILLHRPQQLLEKNGLKLYEALKLIKKRGLVKKIGISVYDPSELDALCSLFRFDLVQAPFNLLDRRLIDSGWLFKFAEQDIELHVRSIFLQGLLLMNSDMRPKIFNKWHSVWKQLDDWSSQSGLTRLQACLHFALSFQEISNVIIGVDGLCQLTEILSAAKGPDLKIPDMFRTNDPNLLNPARWPSLSNI